MSVRGRGGQGVSAGEKEVVRFTFGSSSSPPTWCEDIANATGWRHVGVNAESDLNLAYNEDVSGPLGTCIDIQVDRLC